MIKAKKSLGQNFLTDKSILETIVSITPIKNRTILEIGPGTGNLTSFILKHNPKKVFVIEKDNILAENLVKNFKDQLTVINDDVLNIDENFLFIILIAFLISDKVKLSNKIFFGLYFISISSSFKFSTSIDTFLKFIFLYIFFRKSSKLNNFSVMWFSFINT